jgi:hypothetical protein
MTTREFLVDLAVAKLGQYGKGSPQVEAIWRRVLPANVTDRQVTQLAVSLEWCGAFVLDCLREARLTDATWILGQGFVLKTLKRSAATKTPKPGDVGIRVGPATRPLNHHFLVEAWSRNDDWSSLDGNSPHASRHHHTSLDPTTTFYSVEKLLPVLPPAGFLPGQPHSVPGIQEQPPKPPRR